MAERAIRNRRIQIRTDTVYVNSSIGLRSTLPYSEERELATDVSGYRAALRDREHAMRRSLVEQYKRCDHFIQDEMSWRKNTVKSIRNNLKSRLRVRRALNDLRPHRGMSDSQVQALNELCYELQQRYIRYTAAINELIDKINVPILRTERDADSTTRYEAESRSEETIVDADVATTVAVTPLSSLYHGRRVCEICDTEKPEHEFAYSMVCTHSHCKSCNLKTTRASCVNETCLPETVKCMSCRAQIADFTHVTREGERYSIRVWPMQTELREMMFGEDSVELSTGEIFERAPLSRALALVRATEPPSERVSSLPITEEDDSTLSLPPLAEHAYSPSRREDDEEEEEEEEEEEDVNLSSSSTTSSGSSISSSTIDAENPVTLLSFAQSITRF